MLKIVSDPLCTYRGVKYSPGDRIRDNCNTCMCQVNTDLIFSLDLDPRQTLIWWVIRNPDMTRAACKSLALRMSAWLMKNFLIKYQGIYEFARKK